VGTQSFQTKEERKPPFEVESRGCCTCTSIAQERSPRSILSDSTQRYRNSENAREGDRDRGREGGQWAVRGSGRIAGLAREEGGQREREGENGAERGEPPRNGLFSRARALSPSRSNPAFEHTSKPFPVPRGRRTGNPGGSRARFCSLEESAEKFVGHAVEKRVIAAVSRESSAGNAVR